MTPFTVTRKWCANCRKATHTDAECWSKAANRDSATNGVAPLAEGPELATHCCTCNQFPHAEDCGTSQSAEADALHRFLDAAAGEGLVLDGIDAADLYIAQFPQRYAALIAQAQKAKP